MDGLRQQDEQQPDQEQQHVEKEQPSCKVEQAADARPIRT